MTNSRLNGQFYYLFVYIMWMWLVNRIYSLIHVLYHRRSVFIIQVVLDLLLLKVHCYTFDQIRKRHTYTDTNIMLWLETFHFMNCIAYILYMHIVKERTINHYLGEWFLYPFLFFPWISLILCSFSKTNLHILLVLLIFLNFVTWFTLSWNSQLHEAMIYTHDHIYHHGPC